MPRFFARSLQIVLDSTALSIAFWLAFLFRFEFAIPRSQIHLLLLNWPYVIALQYTSLWLFGVPRMSWRFMTMMDTIRIGFAITASSAVLVMIRFALEAITDINILLIPLGVLA